MRTRAITVPLLLATVAAAGCGSSSNKTTSAAPTSTTATVTPNSTYKVNLHGSSEVPKGALGGAGTVTITVDKNRLRVCWSFRLIGVPHPAVAHIHTGAAGVAGPVLIPLGAAFKPNGCQPGLPKAELDAIVATPAKYYVNVHNKQYPNGAVRAQL